MNIWKESDIEDQSRLSSDTSLVPDEESGFEGTLLAVKRRSSQLDDDESADLTYRRLYEGILSSIPSSVLMFDSQLRIISANRNFLVKSRRKTSETIGKKITDVFSPILLTHTKLDYKIKEIFKSGKALEGGQITYRAPGLSSRIYYYKLAPIKDARGPVESVMLLMDDITDKEKLVEERRLAERHLASVVESASDIVVSMDPERKITTWNSAAERISGYRFKDVRRMPLPDLCAKKHREEMVLALSKLLKGRSIKDAQIDLMTADGEEIPISWSFSPMKGDEGQIIGIVAVGRDLTESQRLQAQLIQSAKMASLGVMAGGIAHEIRNPLAVSSSCAQLLLDTPDDPELRRACAKKIHTGIKRASRIIENLLKFARPSGKEIEEVDINAALDESLALMKSQIGTGNIRLERNFHSSTLRVRGSKNLLQQVFLNMILNACNAMAKGGKLSVSTTVMGGDGRVGVIFRDTGCGIPEANIPKIFDPFFTTMPLGKGTGLGLSISYGLVKHHNGTIEVKSKEGKGSTFEVWLPPKGVEETKAISP